MIGMSYLFPKESPELQFFHNLNYDAVTLGNHGKQNVFKILLIFWVRI